MGKLRSEQLDSLLNSQENKALKPVYLVSGDEHLLVQEACDLIRTSAKQAGFADRELYHADAGFNWHQLGHNLNSPSLFSEKKLVEVKVSKNKPDDAGIEVIRDYCAQAPDDNILLLVFPKLDKRIQSTSWFKAVELCGDTITIWPVGPQQLRRWIEQRLLKTGLRANADAIDILCTKIEGNLLAAVQEIEKLKLITEDGVIDSKLMTNSVMDSARYNVFGLIDRALAGNARGALLNLHGLRNEGIAPLTLLWALTREIRSLTGVRENINLGSSFDFAARKAGIWDTRKTLVRNAVQRIKTDQLHNMMRMGGLADRIIKGQATGDPWNIFQDMVLALTGTQVLSNRNRKLSLGNL